MNILEKLLTALRGGVREVGEAVIDANALRIYEQEIADSKQHLNEAKESLTGVMAKEMQLRREIKAQEEQIGNHEGFCKEALDKGEEALALEVAEKIARLENEIHEHKENQAALLTQISHLKAQIRSGEKSVAEHERQLLMVKTTDSVQKATIAISENMAAKDSQLVSARESLERIRKRQQETTDTLEARKILAEEEGDTKLRSKLKEAGILRDGYTGASVLERLKNSS